jgi:hypothetical protein
MNSQNEKLREIAEILAPNLGIAVGDKVYFFISSSSDKQANGFAPRSSSFSQRGRVLISITWGDFGFPPNPTNLVASLKTSFSNKEIVLEEKVLFESTTWSDEEEKTQVIDNIRKEILDWANKITMGFIA